MSDMIFTQIGTCTAEVDYHMEGVGEELVCIESITPSGSTGDVKDSLAMFERDRIYRECAEDHARTMELHQEKLKRRSA